MTSEATAAAPARGDYEFVFAVPDGWIDLSTDDKAAESPVTLLRQLDADGQPPAFCAIARPPAQATNIHVHVRDGLMRIAPDTPDQIRFALPSTATVLRAEIVTLSQTQAVRLDVDDGPNRRVLYYVPGRLRTAIIRCACPRTEVERYQAMFDEFATTAAHGAETAPETWSEVERARKNDPRRQLFGMKIIGLLLLGLGAAFAIGIPLNLDVNLTLGIGVLLGLVLATVFGLRGAAPMLPGGDGDED